MERLNENFVGYEVLPSGIVGNEKTMVNYCHDFCLENIPDFDRSWVYEVMIEVLSDSYEGDISYFAYEQLLDFMNTVAPIGTVFNSHKGDSSMGFWPIVDFEHIYLPMLPQNLSGYPVYPSDVSKITDKLDHIDTFLMRYTESDYEYSDLQEAIQELSSYDHDDLVNNEALYEWALKLCHVTIQIIDYYMSPKNFSWRYNEETGQIGIFKQLPTYTVVKGSQEEIDTVKLIAESSVWAKLVYVVENRKSGMFRNCEANELDDICLAILCNPHFVPFNETLEQSTQYDRQDMALYISDDNDAMSYVIEKIFFHDYKVCVDRITGSQDITRLWTSIMASGESIDGINCEDVWSLRESCVECEDIQDLESPEWSVKNCVCSEYSEVNNVWTIYEYGFYEKLKLHGAMVYETDSLYLYLQTTYASNHYDDLLQKAWLSYSAEAYMGDLVRKTQIDS